MKIKELTISEAKEALKAIEFHDRWKSLRRIVEKYYSIEEVHSAVLTKTKHFYSLDAFKEDGTQILFECPKDEEINQFAIRYDRSLTRLRKDLADEKHLMHTEPKPKYKVMCVLYDEQEQTLAVSENV